MTCYRLAIYTESLSGAVDLKGTVCQSANRESDAGIVVVVIGIK